MHERTVDIMLCQSIPHSHHTKNATSVSSVDVRMYFALDLGPIATSRAVQIHAKKEVGQKLIRLRHQTPASANYQHINHPIYHTLAALGQEYDSNK